jgi:transcription termination factor Rho
MTTVEQSRFDVATLERLSRDDLELIANRLGLELAQYKRRKSDYIYSILADQAEREGQVFRAGVLEILDEGGYGFLRGAPAITSRASCVRRKTPRSTTAFCV